MQTRRFLTALVLVSIILTLAVGVVSAQGNDLQLYLTKTWGFSLGSQIQGQFTLGISGPADITSVTYAIDGQEMVTVTESPFKYGFSTDTYAVGQHEFTATAHTASGKTFKSNSISAEIVTVAAGSQATVRVLGPIIALVLLIVGIMVAVQVLPLGKRRYEPGTARSYGLAGGAICPKCGRPFAHAFFAPNLVTGKLAHCPYCGKWAVLRRATPEALQAAERAELRGAAPQVHELSPEAELRRKIEESRLSR